MKAVNTQSHHLRSHIYGLNSSPGTSRRATSLSPPSIDMILTVKYVAERYLEFVQIRQINARDISSTPASRAQPLEIQ